MNCSRFCSANNLETLELRSVTFVTFSDAFDKSIRFLFPVPNEKTRIHHFSRLRCLKLYSWEIIENEEERAAVSLKGMKFDEKRVKTSFPELQSLVLHEPGEGTAHSIAKMLLRIRAPYIESLHLKSIQSGMEGLFFPNLSELCLAGKEEETMAWLEFFKRKVKKMDKNKNPWRLDKLCVDFGDVRKWQGLKKAIANFIEMTLQNAPKEALKSIRLTFVIALAKPKDPVYLPRVMESIIAGIKNTFSKVGKFTDGYLSMHLFFNFERGFDEEIENEGDGNWHDEVWEKVGEGLRNSPLPRWVNKMSDKVALSFYAKCTDYLGLGCIAKALNTWELPYCDNGSLIRREGSRLELSLYSKNWDYCKAKDNWEVHCEACEFDHRGWDKVGPDAWDDILSYV